MQPNRENSSTSPSHLFLLRQSKSSRSLVRIMSNGAHQPPYESWIRTRKVGSINADAARASIGSAAFIRVAIGVGVTEHASISIGAEGGAPVCGLNTDAIVIAAARAGLSDIAIEAHVTGKVGRRWRCCSRRRCNGRRRCGRGRRSYGLRDEHISIGSSSR